MTTLTQTETQLVNRIEEVGDKIKKVRETTAAVIFGQDRVIDDGIAPDDRRVELIHRHMLTLLGALDREALGQQA